MKQKHTIEYWRGLEKGRRDGYEAGYKEAMAECREVEELLIEQLSRSEEVVEDWGGDK